MRDALPEGDLSPRAWWWGLGLVLLFAAILRLLWIDRYPPGLHFDEAVYGLQALDLLAHPRPIVFLPAYTGHEPLYLYLLAPALGLFGATATVLRATTAVIGIAGVLTTALVGRALLGPAGGLLAAGFMAASFWHLMFSRQAYRLSVLVALAPLGIWLLLRARARPTPLRAALAGIALGLLGYTYVTARLILIALALYLLIDLLLSGRDRARVRALAITGLTAALVLLPLGAYFLRHPEAFTTRFDQTVGADVLTGIGDTLRMYGLRGDIQPKFNLPLRPALDPILTVLGVVGIGALVRSRRSLWPGGPLLILWLLGALAAGPLTIDSPNHGRLQAAAPPSYLLVAAGALALGALLPRLIRHPIGRRLPFAAGALLIAGQGAIAARDYFLDWAPSAATFAALHGDVRLLAEVAATEIAHDGTVTYAASQYFDHPTVAFLAGDAAARLRWYDGRVAYVAPPPGQSARYLIPSSAAALGASVGASQGTWTGPDGIALEVRAREEAAPIPTSAMPVGLRFGPSAPGAVPWAELVGIDPPTAGRGGDALRVMTRWRLLVDRPEFTPTFFVHAIDEMGRRWGQQDVSPYPAESWRSGETLSIAFAVPLDSTAPAGEYRLRFGASTLDGRPFAVQRSDGAQTADPRSTGVPVAHRGEVDVPRFVRRVGDGDAVLGEPRAYGSVTLLAARWPRAVSVGIPADLHLYWRAEIDRPDDEVLIRLSDAPTAQRDLGRLSLATLDPYRPWMREAAQRSVVRFTPRREDVGEGTLTVRVGGRHHALGQVLVRDTDALFTPPSFARSTDATFENDLALVGLDVGSGSVTLIWRAGGPGSIDLKVFVHALDATGQILAQSDRPLLAAGRAPDAWIAGEFIVDRHPLARATGTTSLAIGLYDPASGARVGRVGGGDYVAVLLAP